MSNSVTAAVLYAASVTLSPTAGASPSDVEQKAHHLKEGKGFRNPWDSWIERSTPEIAVAIMARRWSSKRNVPDTTPPTVTVRKPDFLPTRETPALRATWLGHAAYLVEFPSGLRVLFDPVFSERCSPLTWLGPKRYTEQPCEVEDIPYIDAVAISHNHYDHMDHPTITRIIKSHPKVHFFVPLGNKKWFQSLAISPDQVTELDWWEQRELRLEPNKDHAEVAPKDGAAAARPRDAITATIGPVPCQHMSARSLFDRAQTLWSSWTVESGGQKVYFAGDTGYRAVPELPKDVDDYGKGHDYPHCPAFKQIGDLRGPFDLGLIPIGAYDPRFLMSPMHANPFDSVNIFKDTKCKRAMGIHWGTWVLTEEDVLEPPKLLKEALHRSDIAEEGVFDVCEIGESREF